jgi:4-amino-4-deoxy-L-arabinose transferase-like glycosyltransferase
VNVAATSADLSRGATRLSLRGLLSGVSPRLWPWLAFLLGTTLLAICTLSAGLLSAPIQVFDESRNVFNALEMHQTGLSLVTTFGFHPDLWNTKPPLLIWLMAGSVQMFGPSEWALRLPVALAGVGTIAIVVAFCWRWTHRAGATVLAALLLAASQGYFDRHAVASADYDALLTFFTTGYLCLLFGAIHRRRPPVAQVALIGLLTAAAVLTKSIAGLIPGTGVVLYLVLNARLLRVLRTPRYLLAAAVVVLPVAAYYSLRELAAPGYWVAVVHNELGGRYLQTIGRHYEPPWYYLQLIGSRHSLFSLGALAFLAPLGLFITRGQSRQALLYALCIEAALIGVYSLAATKLLWYLVPVYPFLAISVALSANAADRRAVAALHLEVASWSGSCMAALVAGMFALAVVRVIDTDQYFRTHPVVARFGLDYRSLFQQLQQLHVRRFAVVDGGVSNTEHLVNYNPQLAYYAERWRQRGLQVSRLASVYELPRQRGAIAASCDMDVIPMLSRMGSYLIAPTSSIPTCVAVRLK